MQMKDEFNIFPLTACKIHSLHLLIGWQRASSAQLQFPCSMIYRFFVVVVFNYVFILSYSPKNLIRKSLLVKSCCVVIGQGYDNNCFKNKRKRNPELYVLTFHKSTSHIIKSLIYRKHTKWKFFNATGFFQVNC